MNARRAKVARRLAREATVGLPYEGYIRDPKTGMIRVNPKTTKGVYRAIKKATKRAFGQ